MRSPGAATWWSSCHPTSQTRHWPTHDPTPTLVKRLVGMPGDTIFMRAGVLHVNGIPQRQGYGADQNPKGDPNEVSPLFDWQKKVALGTSRFGPAPAQPTHDEWGPLVVPDKYFWMMGDNRYNSKDSRYWGFVPRDNVRGRPLFIYYTYVPQGRKRPRAVATHRYPVEADWASDKVRVRQSTTEYDRTDGVERTA